MRPIKYRSRDTQKKIMRDPSNPYVSQFQVATFACAWWREQWDIKDHPYKFMQRTGEKDMHGTDIYEWDIVYFPMYKDLATVVFKNARFSVAFHNPPCATPYENELAHRGSDCEVKGNIFENPEFADLPEYPNK